MYLNAIGHYLPEIVVPNTHFTNLTGLDAEWFEGRTGIRERRKAGPDENTHTMGLAAIDRMLSALPYPKEEFDLIVGGTYTPHDTIATLAHNCQHYLGIPDIPAVSISSACSSLINAVEIVQGYFAMGKSQKALVVVSDHNTRYAQEDDKVAGHLWGDAAAALAFSKARQSERDIKVLDILTGGAATAGKAMTAVNLVPDNVGCVMPHGRDVFQNACIYMAETSLKILARNDLTIDDLAYFIPHQANYRISKNVAESLELPMEKLISNIQYLGNTGCAGCAVGLSENMDLYVKGAKILITVFGGGYSFGSMLLEA